MSSPNVTPTPDQQPQAQPPQSSGGVTTTASPSSPNDPNPVSQSGFLSHIGHVLMNAGGRPTPTYSVDANGNETASQAPATPGSLFKNLLTGALMGMAAGSNAPRGSGLMGGMGAGFAGVTNYNQQQNQMAQQQAMQQAKLKMEAQRTADEHQAAQDAHQSAQGEAAVRAATITHLNASTAAANAQVENLNREAKDKFYKDNQSWINQVVNDGGTRLWTGITEDEGMKRLQENPSLGHSAVYRVVGEQPVVDANGNPVVENGKQKMQPIIDIVQPPAEHTLSKSDIQLGQKYGLLPQGDIKEGQSISGAAWADLHRRILSGQTDELTLQAKQADIDARKAQASEARVRASALSEEITDKHQARKATNDWNSALTEAGDDIDKAREIFQKKYPKSYGVLAGAEAMDIAKNGETVTEDPVSGRKVTLKRQPLFTKPQGTGLTPAQQQATLTQVKQDFASGKSRDQIQANLQQAFGTQADGLMKWLDSQGAFTAPAAATPGTAPTTADNLFDQLQRR